MKTSQIILKHTSGSRANQNESFDYNSTKEIKIGRADDAQLKFANDEEGGVSRNHAVISKGSTDGQFFIEDLNSLNGVIVNGVKISGKQEIFVDDIIQLGFKGPKFVFDLNPRPVYQKATELMSVPAATEAYEVAPAHEPVQKVGIGKETFERAITTERKKSTKTLVNSMVVLVCLCAILGFTFKDKIFKTEHTTTTNIIEKEEWRPDVIAANNMDKVMFIELGYNLIHTGTSDMVYHQYMQIEDPKTKQVSTVAVYIQNNQGELEPLLGLKKNTPIGAPIAQAGISGSGFVVDEDGFIMTNKHVAAPWTSTYTFPQEAQTGMLIEFVDNEWQLTREVRAPQRWIPANTTFFGRKPVSGKLLTGEHSYLDVTFAKSEQRTPAKISRVSEVHDVALLKVDMIGDLEKVLLPSSSEELVLGQKVAVMGYPGLSPNGVIVSQSDNPMYENRVSMVPDPTLTDGLVSKVIRNADNASLDSKDYYSFYGEHYQLNISETGAGNSGGPVFNKDGQVVGIFSSMMMDYQGTKITFAIPIKYGLELMGNRKVIK
ncbi:trypsin-like peptidase domain-containing protein [Portibacter lacus]|uniref:FHA domain-containing protein n=1 Tax=Portibacter lacus TaxID=1099794 RepID=A0AA37SNY5_9BACT|nr:trypsin-like peptidase domain-containing protein [Portibacter lacus]GLR16068.1 hypothetical protein GCM10007940_06830 [Portibacter lacus]